MDKRGKDGVSSGNSPRGILMPRGCWERMCFWKLLLLLSVVACNSSSQKSDRESLVETLKNVREKGILFGHQDDLAYGHNWKYIDGDSDVKRVAGDYPAVFGWELGGLERGDQKNLDDVPFNTLIALAIKADEMGGINTFSWHPYSLVNGANAWYVDTAVVKYILPGASLHPKFIEQLDRLAAFFVQLKNKKGEPIPFIFRPWHEMNGDWFWWGRNLTTTDDYKSLFRFTIHYLVQKKGLKNMLVGYSPNGGFQTKDEYLNWYPGDDWVDILGVDEYEWAETENWIVNFQKYLDIIIETAQHKNKLVAISETGSENIPHPQWFTQRLGKVIEPERFSGQISYLMVWRNDPKVHHFFAFDGAPSAPDARLFLQQPSILLLQDFNKYK